MPVMNRSWVDSVSAWLASHKVYPELAQQRGETGNVSVRFTVDRSGRVTEAAIVKASGSALLDEAALGVAATSGVPGVPGEYAAGAGYHYHIHTIFVAVA